MVYYDEDRRILRLRISQRLQRFAKALPHELVKICRATFHVLTYVALNYSTTLRFAKALPHDLWKVLHPKW